MKLATLERRVTLTTRDADGNPIAKIGDQMASYTKTEIKQSDKYNKLVGDGLARVSIGFGEKIGGPYGYSSVDVRVNVTLTCNQDEKTLTDASHLAFQECINVADDIVDQSMTVLRNHLERNYEGNRG
jgi:hypothetical protein